MALRTLHINTERGWRGGEQQAFYLVNGLRRRGHVADVVCRRDEMMARRCRDAGIDITQVTPHGEIDPLAAARVACAIVAGRYDILHAHTAHAHTLAVLANLIARPWMTRRPKVVVSRRVDFSIHKLPWGLSLAKYRFGVDRYLCVSTRIAQVMREDGLPPGMLKVVNSSVDLARFDEVEDLDLRGEFGVDPAAPVIVNLGALVNHKAHWHLVRAMPHVLRQVPGAVCFIAGEGPTRPRLEALIDELGLQGHVVLPGFRADPLRFLKAAHVFAICSDMEGLGSSCIEALAMRRPVVATKAGGVADVVRHGVNGLMVPLADPEALARGIVTLLQNPALAARYAAAGRRMVERNFTVEHLVDRTVAVYRDMLGMRSAE